MRLTALLASGALTLGLAACGDAKPTVATTPDRPAADEVIFAVAQEGGFVAPDATFGTTPTAAVYGDGRVLAPGAMIEIYPGPAYVPLRVGRLGTADVDRLLDLAEHEHLTDAPVDAGQPPVADVPDTVVTIRDRSGHLVVHRANALGMDGTGGGLTADQRDARARLNRFVQALESAVGEVASDEFVPAAYRLRATPAEPAAAPSSEEPQPRVKPWPVDAVDLSTAADCIVVRGDDAGAVRGAMRQADQLTFFTQAEKSYRVTVRPVLPDERGCAS